MGMELKKNKSGSELKTDLCYKNIKKEDPHAIIIGAGAAGLAAARALHEASFKVTVTESRDRIGGRVCTDYTLGSAVDMGASWLHGVCNENPLAPLIGQLGVPLYRTSGDDSVLYDHDLESYALFDKDGNQVPQDLVSKVGETFKSVLEETKKIREENEEDISVCQGFEMAFARRPDLRLEGLPHKVLQWYLCRMEGWFATDSNNISLKCWDEEVLLSGGHGLMVEGYLPVLETLAKGLDIRFNHRVTNVVRDHSGVKVQMEDGTILVADVAIVTAPLGVLKAGIISFEPRLPQWKEDAISRLGVGIENKIALHFDKRFWPNVEFLGVVAESSDACSYFLNLHKATGHRVLVYMPAGKLAEHIATMTDREAADFAFSQLKNILPEAEAPVQFLVSHWGTDINSLGSYSYDKVGNSHDLYDKLQAPVDKLFFAGEATSSSYPGSVHGAYSTGLKAAEDCMIRVSKKYDNVNLLEEDDEEEAYIPIKISRLCSVANCSL